VLSERLGFPGHLPISKANREWIGICFATLVATTMEPDVAKIVEMLGREKSIRRIEKAVGELE